MGPMLSWAFELLFEFALSFYINFEGFCKFSSCPDWFFAFDLPDGVHLAIIAFGLTVSRSCFFYFYELPEYIYSIRSWFAFTVLLLPSAGLTKFTIVFVE